MRSPRASMLVWLLAAAAGQAAPLGTAFSYQGRLDAGGGAASGTYDFQFILYDADVGGSQVGPLLLRDDVAVAAGLFTVPLDFGSVFDGNARYLEIGVRPGASSGAYDILSPRQELTTAPHALFSARTGDATVQRRTVAPTCAAGQYLRSMAADGTPTCPFDVDTNGGGTVTSITAGTGLTGGTITLGGTVAVAFAGSGNASSPSRSDHNHDATYQRTITGSCPRGSSVRSVNANGTVVCTQSGALPGATLTLVDDSGDVGLYTSATIGADGLGLISYYDLDFLDLKVAHCHDTACTSATLTSLDGAGDVGSFTSVAIGADGLGLISYYDVTNGNLKVAHCSNPACTGATVSTLDSAGDVGRFTSVAIGTDGLGLISYNDATNMDLKVAHCNNTVCSSATLYTLDSAGLVGQATAVTIGSDGLGLISYSDSTNADIKVAHCTDTACSSATLNAPDPFGGSATALTIGADGLGLIAYSTGDLRVAHCNDLACSTATATTLDFAGNVGLDPSVAIGADGMAVVSYYDLTNGDLKVAHCNNTVCNSATLTTVDSVTDVGPDTSVTIGADGLPLISYLRNTFGGLKVAHCRNVLCSPYVGR
jgi:hypothetical protein